MGVFFVVHGLKKQGFAALGFRGTNVSEAVCHEVFFPFFDQQFLTAWV